MKNIDTLYKYYSNESWKNVFGDWTIRFTPPKYFNDPFECMPYAENIYSEKELYNMAEHQFESIINDEYKNGPEIIKISMTLDKFKSYAYMYKSNIKEQILSLCRDKVTPLFLKNMSEFAHKDIGILCLTKNQNNLLMWSHYGNSHRGFNVGFNIHNKLFNKRKNNEDQLRHIREVHYTYKRNIKYLTNIDDISNYILLKGKIWEYEEELRMPVYIDEKEDFEWIKQDVCKGLCRLPKDAVKSILFGAAMPEDEIKERCREIRSQADCNHILLQRATLHPSDFDIVINPIHESFYI